MTIVIMLHEEPLLPRPDRDSPLHKIIQEFGRRLCPGGAYGKIDEWEVYDESFRRLIDWADQECRFFEDLQPVATGGREHDLIFDSRSSSWLKFTKPAAAGYCVSFEFGEPSLEPVLPLEYLERLALQNEIFADDVTFVGVGGSRTQSRIITRQSDIPGDSASDEEIQNLMTGDLGFTQLPSRFSIGYADSLAFVREDIAVFDLRPANVVRTESGTIVPIDSIPCRLDGHARTALSRFL